MRYTKEPKKNQLMRKPLSMILAITLFYPTMTFAGGGAIGVNTKCFNVDSEGEPLPISPQIYEHCDSGAVCLKEFNKTEYECSSTKECSIFGNNSSSQMRNTSSALGPPYSGISWNMGCYDACAKLRGVVHAVPTAPVVSCVMICQICDQNIKRETCHALNTLCLGPLNAWNGTRKACEEFFAGQWCNIFN